MSVITTLSSEKAWAPDHVTIQSDPHKYQPLILTTSTVAADINGDQVSLMVGYADDGSAEFVAEGDELHKSNPTLTQKIVTTAKMSQLVRISQEQYSQDQALTRMAESVNRGLKRGADVAYLTHPADEFGVTGILNQGIPVLGNLKTNLDPLSEAIAEIESVWGQPSHIVVSPQSWAHIASLKAFDKGAATIMGIGNNDAERRLLNLPVIVTPAMPQNKVLVVDRNSIISAVGDVRVRADESLYANYDQVALIATWRFGSSVVHPTRNAVVEITT